MSSLFRLFYVCNNDNSTLFCRYFCAVFLFSQSTLLFLLLLLLSYTATTPKQQQQQRRTLPKLRANERESSALLRVCANWGRKEREGKGRRQQKQESFPPYLYYYHHSENARPFLELGRELLHVIKIMNGAYDLFSLSAPARACV